MSAPRIVDQPQEGYWLCRIVKNGPYVPVCIRWDDGVDHLSGEIYDRPPVLVGEINGVVCDAIKIWHTRGQEIDEAEYRGRIDPSVNPYQPVHLADDPIPF